MAGCTANNLIYEFATPRRSGKSLKIPGGTAWKPRGIRTRQIPKKRNFEEYNPDNVIRGGEAATSEMPRIVGEESVESIRL